ncbi:copper resistance protein B [Ferruginivarius sediminum]|uniref:Copper resistance protein B n=1 Tax=Ferruginivarius sediminum TaxID=2661937 RepID=A0A369TGK9_9PROT|nr:copper resistance protein B [Ferruginivarius sediminum]RDD62046.1 copper resistance protein B [Ferruginivarius sediminum]
MRRIPTSHGVWRRASAFAGALGLTATIALAGQPALGAEGQGVHAEPDWPAPVEEHWYGRVLIDRLEVAVAEDEETLNWDAQAWYGGDVDRVWFETEGEHVLEDGEGGELETADLFYSRRVAPFWDLRAGPGYQREYGPGPDRDRFFGVLGVQGLAPYWFETEANLRVSEDGDVSADAELEYDLLLTQRLILQPRFETTVAFQDVPEFGQGAGMTGFRTGLRLRYEIMREFAPYLGVSWRRDLGETADLVEAEGGDTSSVAVVFGVRVWF